MSIAGYERPSQVRAYLAALERERASCETAARLANINEQTAIFEAELARMVATGEGDEPATTDKTLETLAHVGSYEDRVPGAKAIHPR